MPDLTFYIDLDPLVGMARISNRDKYDRLLRYVYLEDGTFVNEVLIVESLATPPLDAFMST